MGLFLPSGPDDAAVRTAYGRYLERHPKFVSQIICLTNFTYHGDKVSVSPYDTARHEWMDFLVHSKIFSGPERQMVKSQESDDYELTEEGRRWMRNDRLCIADGLELKLVVNRGIYAKGQGYRIDVELRYANRAPWSLSAEALQWMPTRMRNKAIPRTVILAKVGAEWQARDELGLSGTRATAGDVALWPSRDTERAHSR